MTTPSNPTSVALLSQITALVLGCIATIWGIFCVYTAAFPGPCGDNPGPGLGVIEAWVLDVPLGLLALAIGAFVKKGSSNLRKGCLITAVVTLLLPPLATFFLQRWHCP